MVRALKSDMEVQQLWEDKIRRAKAVRKNWKDQFKVDMGYDYFEGKQNPGYPNDEWLTINKIYAHIKSQLPALYSADPYFYVKLKRSYSPDPQQIAIYEQQGKIRQSYLNYLKDEIGLKEEVRMCIQDAMFSYGVAMTYYNAGYKPNPDAGSPMINEDGSPMLSEDMEILMEPDEIPVNERYCVERIHPDDFLWDEDCGPTSKTWKWLAHCSRMTLDEARGNKLFSRGAMRDLEHMGGESLDEEKKRREDRKKGGDLKGRMERAANEPKADRDGARIVYLWKIYDLKKSEWTVIAEGAKTPLVNAEPLPPGVEQHPYSILRFTLRDDSPYPIPPVSMGLDVQREYNVARSRIMTHRKRFNRKYKIMGEVDDNELSKLESGEDGTMIHTGMPGSGNDVVPIQDAPLDQMSYIEVGYLNTDLIELLGGSTDEARGIAGADSATQASILDKRLDMKEGDAMSMVVDLVKDIAKKLDQQVQANITGEEAVKIVGPEGEFWQTVRKEDYQEINGQYEYDVNVGATIPRMPQTERASWMSFLQLVASTPQLLTSKALLKEMAAQHHIDNEVLIDEVYKIGQMMVAQQQAANAPPGTPGSLPGVPQSTPASVMGGIQGGPKSLNLPLAGNE